MAISCEYVPDPADYFAAYDREMQRKLDRLPVCDKCGEAIQDEYLFEDDDGCFCEYCWEKHVIKKIQKEE